MKTRPIVANDKMLETAVVATSEIFRTQSPATATFSAALSNMTAGASASFKLFVSNSDEDEAWVLVFADTLQINKKQSTGLLIDAAWRHFKVEVTAISNCTFKAFINQ